ncbi:hypothetical protein DPMN_018498 [Dreissena polymorpha]|uniref:Uncharacterized protein n=1 Tax=Dreissena polymorpha TaxID=45954 RepID=A0A9D4NJG1_DREPO|nr:hypothetical protein DPMN_018498 [Dreissena polymorpha]
MMMIFTVMYMYYDNKDDNDDEGYDDDINYVDADDGGDLMGMGLLVIRRIMVFVSSKPIFADMA